jgi:prevent-host-death family protein
MTTKTYGAGEFRENLRTALDDAMIGRAESIVERNGVPAAVMISYDSWKQLQAERAARKRRHAEARARYDAGEFYSMEEVEVMLKKDGLLS